ncbi:zinc finger MYM-type protein 1-like [Oryzias latipes]|uniref:Transposase n=1 Tax=Oryzias latipes TaxID=8090 RepID=A6BLM9_ORYLA|nr:zinc finger MYM-type protein 1-like [Oryzias latipes]XP_023815685.1 zinc finger MYM-type protein 1-like [Oryzias latipes]XP_023819994.1 zinc finger MYM-type protein 1-like [Oryzias latipes]AJD87371.1 Tol1 transposase [synthetic construct]BAF64515.1 transposase [Oryzias latipes]BAF64516.1 transposase [Oryzias latipes]
MEKKRSKPSGAQFRKKRKEEEEKRDKEKGALLRYFGSSTTAQDETSTSLPAISSATVTVSPPQDELPSTSSATHVVPQLLPEQSFDSEAEDVVPSTSTQLETSEMPGDETPLTPTAEDQPLPTDPAKWPSPLTDRIRMELVRRGPSSIPPDFVFPRNDSDGRSCHHHYFRKTLVSGEKIARTWLMYSKVKNSLFCFCCKLFSNKNINLTTSGTANWKHASTYLTAHEKSPEHLNCMKAWKELSGRIRSGKTIDKQEMALLEEERVRWRAVLTRLIAIVQSLAVRNLALRGHTETLFTSSNGNFLKEVELMARFDPIMKDHLNRVLRGTASHNSYIGHHVQNELIDLLSSKILSAIVDDIKKAKYFSIILDCTLDISHTEQLSVIIRVVSLMEKPQIREHFMGFLEAEESTGQHLASMILNRLEELGISFEDCRGQSYDNGANMKGKNKGVQARLLEKNPRALFLPCGAHTLNLVVCDAAKRSVDAMSYFGVLQKLYTLFSASAQRWAILKSQVSITLKSWTETRWESKIKSIEPMRYQGAAVREALIEVRDKTKDPVIKAEAQSLSEEVGSYRFNICTVVWHDILSTIKHVSKLMQSPNMHVDLAVSLLKKTEQSLQSYRANGFVNAQMAAKEMCKEMNVEAILKQKRIRSTKCQFSYESHDEPFSDALKKLEVEFFNVVVDEALSAIAERFSTLEVVQNRFGVLTNFPSLGDEELTEQCEALGNILHFEKNWDLDSRELVQEIKNLPNLPSTTPSLLELISFMSDKDLSEIYPNFWTALRIALTLPVTVAQAERSFSKLKLIKSYLRSTMSQERLTNLAVVSINHSVGEQISYDDVIDEFASRKARKVRF